MKSSYSNYDFEKSRNRIDEILNASNDSFENVKQIPSRDSLTFTNGYYTYCTAVFVDIRNSSGLPDQHTKPVLAKIYRSYISEIVALMNGLTSCREVNIEGDSVWGVFNTPKKPNIDEVFSLAARISSLIDVLNHKLSKKNFSSIEVGIGIEYGRALMIKAGFRGSTINEVVWMGDVVNKASKLCGFGNKLSTDKEVMLSSTVYENLKDTNQNLLTWNSNRGCYHSNVVNVGMRDWLDAQ